MELNKLQIIMRNILLICLAVLLFAGCASKRYAKKGAEFEAVGYYEKAAEMYYESVKKNNKNVEAQIGLKKTAQLTLDKKLGQFLNAYNANNSKDAVYEYIEAEKFHNKIENIGTDLVFPGHYEEYYNEVKDFYLRDKYKEATLLLEEENFAKSEDIFDEILKIDPNYYDVVKLKNTAHYEPIYRKAIEFYNTEKYRSAYYRFNEVLKAMPMYKEANHLMNKSLENALITIAIVEFKNSSRIANAEIALNSRIKSDLLKIDSPFLKIIDRENSERINEEQMLYLEGNVNKDVSAKAGKMLGAKYLLTGVLEELVIQPGKLKKEIKKGFTQQKYTKKEGEEEITYYVYNKVKYEEFRQSRKVYCRFQFSLISAETGEVVLSDVISYNAESKVHYIKFEGDRKNLYSGTWVSKTKDSTKDVVNKSDNDYKKVQNLLKANKSLKTIASLKNETNNKIAKSVANKIEIYDPEK